MRVKQWIWLLLCWPAIACAAQVEEVRTTSGLTAWLVEDHSLPVVAVSLAFKNSGYASDTKELQGRAQALAYLLSEGAGPYDAVAFHRLMDERAIGFDTDVDADTLRVELKCISEHCPFAFSMLGTALTKPRFEAQALARVREQMATQRKQREQNPQAVAARGWYANAFPDRAYGFDVLGSETSLSHLTPPLLHAFAKEALSRKRAVISVVGDITPEALSAFLEKALQALPVGAEAPAVSKQPMETGKEVILARETPQSAIVFGFPALSRHDPDYYAAYTLDYLMGGGGFSSRLTDELRTKRGLTYGSDTDLVTLAAADFFTGEVSTRNEKAAETIAVLKETLAQIRDKGFTDEEVAAASEFITGSFPLRLDTNEKLAHYLLAMQLDDLGKDYLEKRNGYFSGVTAADVNRVAARFVNPDRMLLVVAGNPQKKEP